MSGVCEIPFPIVKMPNRLIQFSPDSQPRTSEHLHSDFQASLFRSEKVKSMLDALIQQDLGDEGDQIQLPAVVLALVLRLH